MSGLTVSKDVYFKLIPHVTISGIDSPEDLNRANEQLQNLHTLYLDRKLPEIVFETSVYSPKEVSNETYFQQ